MDDDKHDEILAAIRSLKQDVDSIKYDNTLAHKGLEAMIKNVQKTQGEHTESFVEINRQLKYITREIRGPITDDIKRIQKKLGLEVTDLVKEQEKIKL